MTYQSNRQNSCLDGKNIYLNGTKIENVNKFVYLGIRVDSNLTFNDHTKHLYQSAMNMVFTLRKIRPYISTKTAVLIFKAHILSRIEYGNIFCFSALSSTVMKLQKLVNKALRICLKESNLSNVFEMHRKVGLLPLDIRKNIALLKLMYQFSRCTDAENPLIDGHRGSRVTRSQRVVSLKCHLPRSELFKRSCIYQGPSRWLKLPISLKESPTLEAFKTELKVYYQQKFETERIV